MKIAYVLWHCGTLIPFCFEAEWNFSSFTSLLVAYFAELRQYARSTFMYVESD